jgi:hypothetical protein
MDGRILVDPVHTAPWVADAGPALTGLTVGGAFQLSPMAPAEIWRARSALRRSLEKAIKRGGADSDLARIVKSIMWTPGER